MKRAGDGEGIRDWQLDCPRYLFMTKWWKQKNRDIHPGVFDGQTTNTSVIIPENEDGGKRMSELEYIPEENIDRFHIEDDQTAEWALQQIKNAEEEKAKWKAFYAERKKAVDATCDLTIANMEALLQTYFASVPHKVTDTQENYQLPSGKLVFKKQAPEYDRNDSEVIEWLQNNGGGKFVKMVPVLDWAGLKKTLTVLGEDVADENGVVIPCIKAIRREDVFKVELKKED